MKWKASRQPFRVSGLKAIGAADAGRRTAHERFDLVERIFGNRPLVTEHDGVLGAETLDFGLGLGSQRIGFGDENLRIFRTSERRSGKRVGEIVSACNDHGLA